MVDPIPDPEEATNPLAWHEVPSNEDPGTGRFDNSGASEDMLVQVRFQDENRAIALIPGYAYTFGTGANMQLRRVIPQNHSRKPWLKATHCSRLARVPIKESGTYLDQSFTLSGVEGAGVTVERVDGHWGPYYAYKVTRLMVSFSTLQYALTDDDDLDELAPFPAGKTAPNTASLYPGGPGMEQWRFTEVQQVYDQEILQIARGKYLFINTTPGLPPGNPAIPRITPKVYSDIIHFVVLWRDVPIQYLLNSRGVASNLIAGINHVNASEWSLPIYDPAAGGVLAKPFAAGTLLLGKPEIRPTVQNCDVVRQHMLGDSPLAGGGGTAEADRQQYGHLTPRSFDVSLPMTYFEPPTDAGYPFRGHNLVIHPARRQFYLVGEGVGLNPQFGDATKPMYLSYDFDFLFKHPLN